MNAPCSICSLSVPARIICTKSPWTRRSPVTSGWNEVAISAPCRTATILPAAGPSSTVASTSTDSPTCSTQGARMKTACTGPPSRCAKSTSVSKESTCRPKALRRTVMSMPPSVSWSGLPSTIRSASRIIPAQDPYAGRPARRASRSGSRTPKARASLSIVVDSPPGSTMPSRPSSSLGRRTDRGCAPQSCRARKCSRTSPWRARTPTVDGGAGHDRQAYGPAARVPARWTAPEQGRGRETSSGSSPTCATGPPSSTRASPMRAARARFALPPAWSISTATVSAPCRSRCGRRRRRCR